MSDENWSLSIFDDEISNELRCDWSLSTEEWDFLFVHDNLEKLEKIFHLFNRDKSIWAINRAGTSGKAFSILRFLVKRIYLIWFDLDSLIGSAFSNWTSLEMISLFLFESKSIDDNSTLFIAIEMGILEPFKLVMKHRLSSSTSSQLERIENSKGESLLCNACKFNRFEIVKFLIEDVKFDVNFIGTNGETALFATCYQRNLEILKFLVAVNGIDVNLGNIKNGNSPITASAFLGYTEIVKHLFEFGSADLNHVNLSGQNALWRASDSGQIEVIKYLIGTECCFSLLNKMTIDPNPLVTAAARGYLEIVKLLVENKMVDVNSMDSYGNTALFLASCNSHLEVVKFLIKIPTIDLNRANKQNETPLFGAAERNSLVVVQFLIEIPTVDVNRANFEGETPLIFASHHSNLQMVQLLVSKKASIESSNKFGETALIRATRLGHLKIVEYLFHKGASVNVADNQGETPLLIAIRDGYIDLVQFLIKNGSKLTAANKYGETPLVAASQSGRENIVKILKEAMKLRK